MKPSIELIRYLKEERVLAIRGIEAIDFLLTSYNSTDSPIDKKVDNINKDENYPVAETHSVQIRYIIKTANRFLHNTEIRNSIKANSLRKGDLDVDRIRFQERFSRYLQREKTIGGYNLVSIRVGNSNKRTFWGFKGWLNDQGDPLKKHMYKEINLKK